MKKRADLPEDLVIEILSYLPVKSLLRFKCVCKSWYDLFLTPDFISKHSVNSDHHRLILSYDVHPTESRNFMIFEHNKLDVVGDFIGHRDLPNKFRLSELDSQLWSHRLLGSYNGLVCVADECLKNFAFWNPATRQFKFVNQSKKINAKLTCTEHAFGYDFETNDYKVMSITSLIEGGPPYKYDQIEVYSFNSDSWKISDAVFPDGVCLDEAFERPTICVNGIYSTMAFTTHANTCISRDYFMLTIDMSNESFILTPLPEEIEICQADNWENQILTELNNSVAFIEHQNESVENSFEIFILNEYGPNGIWIHIYSIVLGFWGRPIGFWKNEELFLYNDYEGGCFISCDLRTFEWNKTLAIYGSSMQILEYKESLVWTNDRRF